MGLFRPCRPGWLLEGRSDPSPRGMAAHPPASAMAEDRTRLTDPLALFRACGGALVAISNGRYMAQTDAIERLGISALARLRRRARGRAGAPVRPRTAATSPATGPRPSRRNSPERWYFCERHAAEYNRNWNYFEGLTAEDAAAREAERAARRRTASARPTIMAGAAPATAAEAATRCARSTCSSSRPTPVSRRSRPPIAASPRPTTPTPRPAMPRRRSASRRSRPPTRCCARPRSGGR